MARNVQPHSPPDPVLDAIRALDAKIDALRADVRALAHAQRRPDRVLVLAAIAGAVNDHAFTAAEVVAHAAIDTTLAAALDAARMTNARSIGHYLRAVEGRVVDGVRVTRIGAERDGVIWRCEFLG